MKILYLLRGLPGAGKSAVAARLVGRSHVFSADDWFVGSDGVYRFDPSGLPAAHAWCLAAAERAMRDGMQELAVANTNLRRAHMQPYRDLADRFGYRTVVITVESDFQSVHGVGPETMAAMAKEFEK